MHFLKDLPRRCEGRKKKKKDKKSIKIKQRNRHFVLYCNYI